jgi:hypothetical protein
VEDRPLQHPLETERRLHFAVVVVGQARRGFGDELLERLLQLADVRAAGPEHLANLGRIENREQQVLDRHELMACFARGLEGLVQAEFEFARQHVRYASSIVHSNGC